MVDKVESDSSDTHLEALFSSIDSIVMGEKPIVLSSTMDPGPMRINLPG